MAKELLVAESSPIDPDLVRTNVLDALRAHPSERQMQALAAVQRGEVDIEDRPMDGEIAVQIGDLTVVVDRDRCLSRGSDPG
jgi:hypothetical protein